MAQYQTPQDTQRCSDWSELFWEHKEDLLSIKMVVVLLLLTSVCSLSKVVINISRAVLLASSNLSLREEAPEEVFD